MDILRRSIALAGLFASPLTGADASGTAVPDPAAAALEISEHAREAIAAALAIICLDAPQEITPVAFSRKHSPASAWGQESVSLACLGEGTPFATERVLNRFRLTLPPAFRFGVIDAYFYLHQRGEEIHLFLREPDGRQKRFVAAKPASLRAAGGLRWDDFRPV